MSPTSIAVARVPITVDPGNSAPVADVAARAVEQCESRERTCTCEPCVTRSIEMIFSRAANATVSDLVAGDGLIPAAAPLEHGTVSKILCR